MPFIGPATRIISVLLPTTIIASVKSNPPIPPEPGRSLKVADDTRIEKPTQAVGLWREETEKALWKNVEAARSPIESDREKAIIELKTLTSQAGQYELLVMAYWFEERTHYYHANNEEAYINSQAFPHLASLMRPRNINRLTDRVLGRLGRFQRWWHGSHHVGVAVNGLSSLLPFLQVRKHRQAVRKLIGLLSSRERFLKDRIVEILLERSDFIAPKEFRAAALKIVEALLKPEKFLKGGYDWDLDAAFRALERLMPRLSSKDQREIILMILRGAPIGFPRHGLLSLERLLKGGSDDQGGPFR